MDTRDGDKVQATLGATAARHAMTAYEAARAGDVRGFEMSSAQWFDCLDALRDYEDRLGLEHLQPPQIKQTPEYETTEVFNEIVKRVGEAT